MRTCPIGRGSGDLSLIEAQWSGRFGIKQCYESGKCGVVMTQS